MVELAHDAWWSRRSSAEPALIIDAKTLSYADLADGVLRVSSTLVRHKVQPGSHVLFGSADKSEFIMAFWGILGAGCVAVPMPEGASAATITELASAVAATVALVGHADQIPDELSIEAIQVTDALSSVPSLDEPIRGDDVSPAMVMFTSGTTAKKKGVVLSHQNLVAATRHINATMRFDRPFKEYVAIPLHHSFGLGRMRCLLASGGTVIAHSGLLNPALMVKAMMSQKADALSSVPAGFSMFLGKMAPIFARVAANLERIEIGSAFMPSEHKLKLLELCAKAKIYMHYGLTEASRSAFIEFGRDRAHLETVGRPAVGVKIEVIDNEGNEQPPNAEGELLVSGPHVMGGYLDDPDRTARVLSERGFRTGDFGFFDDDGYLHLLGRRDEMINCGGIKISPLELESRLAEIVPGRQVAVIGVADPQGMAGQVPVIAFVGEPVLELSDLLERGQGLFDQTKLPRGVVQVDLIPVTENGKTKRAELTALVDVSQIKFG